MSEAWLISAVTRVSSADTRAALADALIDALHQGCGVRGATVYVRAGQVLKRLAVRGLGPELEAASRALTLEDGVQAIVLSGAQGQPFDLNEGGRGPLSELIRADKLRFILPMPLGEGLSVGLMIALWSEAPSEETLARVNTLGRVAGLVAERLNAEAEERRSRRVLEAVLANIDEGVIVATPQGRYLTYSPTLERLTGWSREEVEREGWTNLVYPDPSYRANVMATVTTLAERGSYTTEWSLTSSEGELLPMQVDSRFLPMGEGEAPLMLGVFRDQRVSSEQRLVTQRDDNLLALGRLSGMLAHDFNNALGAMLGHAELISGRSGLPDDVRGRARVIVDAARRASGLTERMLTLAHPNEVKPIAVDLAAEAKTVVALLAERVPEDVEVRLDFPKKLRPADADPSALHQALLNLLTNALDAVAEAGEVVVSGAEATMPEAPTWGAEDRDVGAPALMLEVKDDGPGFSEAALERLFEPLFTEKVTGHGIGLRVVQGVARAHRGALQVINDRGAVIRLFLPASPRAFISVASGRGLRARGEEQLWVMDDETALMEFMDIALSARGYAVRCFSSPSELIVASGERGGPDLLLLNVVLPTLRGQELLTALRQHGFTAPVLWCSGYTPEAAGLSVQESACFLRKPFTGNELARKVREVLDRSL